MGFFFWTKINVQKQEKQKDFAKKGVFFAYVDKSEIHEIFCEHNFFFENVYFI
jgi:hypothetical protein